MNQGDNLEHGKALLDNDFLSPSGPELLPPIGFDSRMIRCGGLGLAAEQQLFFADEQAYLGRGIPLFRGVGRCATIGMFAWG
jgi:hypothetical protein